MEHKKLSIRRRRITSPGGFIERGRAWGRRQLAGDGQDKVDTVVRVLGTNLGAPTSSGCQWSSPRLWSGGWRPWLVLIGDEDVAGEVGHGVSCRPCGEGGRRRRPLRIGMLG
jgi:hypothetical protein